MSMSKPTQFNFIPFKTTQNEHSMGNGEQENGSLTPEENSQEKARKEGHEQGYQEGLNAGIEQGKGELFQIEQQINSNLAILVENIGNTLSSLEDAVKQKSKELQQVVALIVKKVAGDIIKEDPEAKIESIVKQCIPHIFDKKAVVIKVSRSMADSLGAKINSVAEQQGYNGQIKVVGDESIQDASCNIEWDNGGIEYNQDRLWGEIYKILGVDGVKTEPQSTDDDAAENKQVADNAMIEEGTKNDTVKAETENQPTPEKTDAVAENQ